MRSRRGDQIGFIVIDDQSGRLEASLFSDTFEAHKHKVVKDSIVVLEGEVSTDDYTGELKLKTDTVYTIEQARNRFASGLSIALDGALTNGDLSDRLRRVLNPHRTDTDGCSVAIVYRAEDAVGRIELGEDWQVSASDELLLNLRTEFGDSEVQLDYARAQ